MAITKIVITGGVAPWTCGSNVEYQKCQMKLGRIKQSLRLSLQTK